MVTTSTSMRYNVDSEQIERVSIFCKKTRKILGRVSIAGVWTPELRQWLWCRGCHCEHEITHEHIEEARARDAKVTMVV